MVPYYIVVVLNYFLVSKMLMLKNSLMVICVICVIKNNVEASFNKRTITNVNDH